MAKRGVLQQALAEIDREIEAAEKRLEKLRLERLGAEALIARVEGPPDAPVTHVRTTSDAAPASDSARGTIRFYQRHGATGHAEFVADILAENPDGLHISVIEAKASERGRPLNNEQVRSAVTWLRRKGLAENIDRGIWRGTPQTTDSPASEAGLSVLSLSPTLEGGDDDASPAGDRGDQVPRWNDGDRHHPSVMEG